MIYLLALIPVAVPIALACKGNGFRGLWIGLIAVGLAVGLLFNSMYGDIKGPEGRRLIVQGNSVDQVVKIAVAYDSISFLSFAFAVGCFFAACFYRNRRQTAQTNEAEVAVIRGDKSLKKCPYCAEIIKAEAIVCRFCGKDVSPVPKTVNGTATEQ